MTATLTHAPAGDERSQEPAAGGSGFHLELANFNGPFDVLLHLITKRELDITEVALAEVTDEFIAYLRALQAQPGDGLKMLDETTEFLVVASTLLDLKAARLLPRGEMADDEDFELLEARDLLFARLLQYKAFKEAAAVLGDHYDAESAHIPREVPLEPHFAALLPELIFNITPQQFAQIARQGLAPKPEPETEVGISHLHGANVTIGQEAETMHRMLTERGSLDFTQLVADAESQLVVVVRFLALLEMFRQKAISFRQPAPLAPLVVQLTQDGELDAAAMEDDYTGTAAGDNTDPRDNAKPGNTKPTQGAMPDDATSAGGAGRAPQESLEPVHG